MTTSKLNALDRYQQVVHMKGHHNTFEYDLLDRAADLSSIAFAVGVFTTDVYKTKNVNTEAYEEELSKGLLVISQIATSLGLKMSDLATKGINSLEKE